MLSVEHAERSDPGRHPDKQVNEDACGYRSTPLGHLAVVCDGMGGHQYGKEASAAALAAILEVFEAAPIGADPRDVLRRAIETANERVFALASPAAGSTRPGSTAVAILLHEGGAEIAHVGDSRCYRVRHGAAEQMTRDHSIVAQFIAAGVMSEEQAKKHPDAKRITRALGAHESVEVEMPQTIACSPGDFFLLCSDGLSDLVTGPDIAAASSDPADRAAERLVELANSRGGHDNITAVIVRAAAEPKAQTIGTIDVVPSQRPRPSVTPTPSPVVAPVPILPLEPEKRGVPKALVVIGAAVVALLAIVIGIVALRPPPAPESNCNVLYDFGGGGAQPCSGGVTWQCGADKFEFLCKCPGDCDCRKNDHFVTSVAPPASVCGACSFREPAQSVASQCGFPW